MKKPWPSDALMLVCESPEKANVAKMESVNPGNCRDCNAAIVYDSRSMRRAEQVCKAIAAKAGKSSHPVKFFCQTCFRNYDMENLDLLINHAGGQDKEYPATKRGSEL